MTCPNEYSLAVYVDDELDTDETRTLETHLIECLRCRTRIIALRDEGALIRNALHGRAPKHALEVATPEPGLAIGLPVTIAAVTIALSVGSFLIETRMPPALELLNPLRLIGAYEMAFDLIFLLRDRVPGLLEFGLSIGVMASVSALGCFLLGAIYRRTSGPTSLGILFLCILAIPDSAEAFDLRFREDTRIAANETIHGTLVATGDVIHIDGTIDGDLIAVAERFSIRGTVRGNVYAFAREAEFAGSIEGSLHAVVEEGRIESQVNNTVYAFGEDVTLASTSKVGRDVFLFSEGAVVGGQVGRDVVFAGEWIEVRGTLGRDLDVIGADRATLLDDARIGGDVAVRLGRGNDIERAPGAVVSGEVRLSHYEAVEHYLARYSDGHFYMVLLVFMMASFSFAMLLSWLHPGSLRAERPTTQGFLRGLLIGFVSLIATPVAIVLLGMTIVGIPVAVLLAFLFVTLLYCAHLVVASLVGRAIYAPRGDSLGDLAIPLLVGVIVVWVLLIIPFVGPALRVVVILYGLGLLGERLFRLVGDHASRGATS